MSEGQILSKAQLVELAAKNNDRTYISIHENVYDITTFLDEHPGGEEVLKEHQIKKDFRDATEAFEDVGHSLDARDLMKKYLVGSLESKKDKPQPKLIETARPTETSGSLLTTLILPALGLVAVAIAYQFFAHKQ